MEILGDEIIVTRGYEDCVIAVNKRQWEKLLTVFDDKPFTTSPVRDTRRFLIGGASEVDLDKQGRFVLPVNLKNFAKDWHDGEQNLRKLNCEITSFTVEIVHFFE